MRISATIVFILVSISIGCTGYAVYADEVWYGINFDYPPESDIRFSVSDLEDHRVFTMEFFDNDMMIWIPTVGMNECGLQKNRSAHIQGNGITVAEMRTWE